MQRVLRVDYIIPGVHVRALWRDIYRYIYLSSRVNTWGKREGYVRARGFVAPREMRNGVCSEAEGNELCEVRIFVLRVMLG